ncbi:MAG: acetyltransferase [Bdellovibrionales bacterium]|nr:acetyltransferase [Bdellovibrionales bacterium]
MAPDHLDVYIIGAGGFAREVLELIRDINKARSGCDGGNPTRLGGADDHFNVVGFLDKDSENWGRSLNGVKILGDESLLMECENKFGVALGIGNPRVKRTIVERLQTIENICFPNFIHPSVIVGSNNTFGVGNVITAGNIITCNVEVKNHAMINLACTVGHDCVIDNYVVISPGVNISGYCQIGEGAYLGTGSSLLENRKIGDWAIVGGSALVNKDVPRGVTVVGVPAKPLPV